MGVVVVVVVVVVTAGVIGAHGSQAWNSNLLPLHLDIHVRLRNLNELPGLGQEDGLQADHSAHGEKPSEKNLSKISQTCNERYVGYNYVVHDAKISNLK